jgi:micrococcal nuclease
MRFARILAILATAAVVVGCGVSPPAASGPSGASSGAAATASGRATPSASATPASSAAARPTATANVATAPKGPTKPTGLTTIGTVKRVVDGDTIHVLIDGHDFTVRYIGMNAPESVKPGTPVEPYGKEASAANQKLVGGQQVILEKDVSETDQYGRLLRDVWLRQGDGYLLVDYDLVVRGFAEVSTFPPDVKYVKQLLAGEKWARDHDVGLWSLPDPGAAFPTPSPN